MADSETPNWMHSERSTEDPRIMILRMELPAAPSNPPPPLSFDEAVEYAIAAMRGGQTEDLRRAFDKIEEDDGSSFRKILEAATCCSQVSDDFRERLNATWSARGHCHRAEVQDDDLIIRAFRCVFPPYNGSELVLYRGERASEINAGRVGLNWSTDQETATMFASGLCTTYGCDGVLLKASAEPSAVIATPHPKIAKSLSESEHIVDPRMLVEIEELARFPPSI